MGSSNITRRELGQARKRTRKFPDAVFGSKAGLLLDDEDLVFVIHYKSTQP